MKRWHTERRKLIHKFTKSLKEERSLFSEFFIPAQQEYGDILDWELRKLLRGELTLPGDLAKVEMTLPIS
jgi:hypothetical protein